MSNSHDGRDVDVHTISIAGVARSLPLFEVAPGLRIAVLNILGDTELVTASAKELATRLDPDHYDVLVTAEAKSIPLIHQLSVETGSPYVVLRKMYRPYMGEAIRAETQSITTGTLQTLFLDQKDASLVRGARVVLVDDVISTGSTSRGMSQIVQAAGGEVVGEVAILTEGDAEAHARVVSLGHLPLFED